MAFYASNGKHGPNTCTNIITGVTLNILVDHCGENVMQHELCIDSNKKSNHTTQKILQTKNTLISFEMLL